LLGSREWGVGGGRWVVGGGVNGASGDFCVWRTMVCKWPGLLLLGAAMGLFDARKIAMRHAVCGGLCLGSHSMDSVNPSRCGWILWTL
jgi:hypothetical protein